MEVRSNEKKVCLNCGEIIEPDYIHCKSCGFELDVYEPNKIEIATTLKKSRNYALCSCFTTGIIFTIFALLLGITLGEITSAAILGLAIIWIIILISIFPILLVYKKPSKIRKFSISDKSIRIMIPHKTKFKINWDQIEAIKDEKNIPIEVKQYKIGLSDVMKFETVIRRQKKKAGFMIGFGYTSDVLKEIGRFKIEEELEIKNISINDLFVNEPEKYGVLNKHKQIISKL
ncbi:MAG: hypothetical protein ACFFHD_14860 [Promethearchaeota archaeon]